MGSRNPPFPGQTLAKTYMTQWAYQWDAHQVAMQGWRVQNTAVHYVGGRYKRLKILVTYVYRPGASTTDTPALTQPVAPPDLLYHYPLWEALLVALLTVLGAALTLAGVGFGAALFLAGIIWAIVRDGYGLRNMRNLFNWETMSEESKTWLVLGIFLVFEVFLPIYLVRMMIDSLGYQRQAALSARLEVKRRTAELESQLGIVPGVEGECRVCHKPLQIGADYCAYCGEPVAPRPRICPVCATTTLPDAKFCPKCRAELPPIA